MVHAGISAIFSSVGHVAGGLFDIDGFLSLVRRACWEAVVVIKMLHFCHVADAASCFLHQVGQTLVAQRRFCRAVT